MGVVEGDLLAREQRSGREKMILLWAVASCLSLSLTVKGQFVNLGLGQQQLLAGLGQVRVGGGEERREAQTGGEEQRRGKTVGPTGHETYQGLGHEEGGYVGQTVVEN